MTYLTLRICGPEDDRALRELAQRDSAEVPVGRLLAAEGTGRLIAAISLQSGAVIADPFLPTADVVELLRRRAEQIRNAERGGGSTRLSRLRRPLKRSPSSAEI